MLTKILREKSFYEKYFMEADDEEDNVTVKVATRSNRGTDYSDDTTTARVEPRRSTATDYSKEGDAAPEEEEAPDEDTPTADGGEDEGTDYSDEGDDTAQDDEAGEDTAEDDGGEDEATDYSDEGDDEGGGEDEATDYSDEGDGEGEGEQGESDSNDENQDSDDSSSDEDPETKQKKFYIYKRYLRLYNLLGIFINKIQGVIKNDVSQNAVLKIVVSNLTRVRDTLYDYMTIKYKTQTYVQVLFFLETAMSVVKLNFELLRNNKINLKQ